MEFFGISSAKIILILVIAIVLLGPDQVPQMVRTVGKFIRDFRRWSKEMSAEFDEATGDLRKEFNDTVTGLKSEIEQTQSDLRSQLNPITETLRDPLGKNTPAAEPVPAAPAFAAATATLNEANPFATQTPTYTPPQSVPVLTEANGFGAYNTDGASGASDVHSPYTNGVNGSNGTYTDGTIQDTHGANGANGTNGANGANGTNGANGVVYGGNGTTYGVNDSAFVAPRATKVDPFADLVALVPAPAPAITTVTSMPVATFAPVESAAPLEPMSVMSDYTPADPTPEIALVGAAPAGVAASTPRTVGRSVSGTRYGRKKSS